MKNYYPATITLRLSMEAPTQDAARQWLQGFADYMADKLFEYDCGYVDDDTAEAKAHDADFPTVVVEALLTPPAHTPEVAADE